MTDQEIYDIVAKHLLTQKVKSDYCNPHGIRLCKYRGPNNLKCAFGILITDEEYDPDMEGSSAHSIIQSTLTRYRNNIQLISELQSIHDKLSPYEWYDSLKKVAGEYNLNTKVLEQFKWKSTSLEMPPY